MPKRILGNAVLFFLVAMVAPISGGIVVVNNLDVFAPSVGGGGIAGQNYNFLTGQFETAFPH